MGEGSALMRKLSELQSAVLAKLFDVLPYDGEATVAALADVLKKRKASVARALRALEEYRLVERRACAAGVGRWGETDKWRIRLQ